MTHEFRFFAFSRWGMGILAGQSEMEGILEPVLPDTLGRNPFYVLLSAYPYFPDYG